MTRFHTNQRGTPPEDAQAAIIRRAAHDWQLKLSAPPVNPADLMAFEQWRNADPRHEDAFNRASAIYEAFGDLAPADINADLRPQPSVSRLTSNKSSARRIWRPSLSQAFFGAGAVAAAIALFFMVQTQKTAVPQTVFVASQTSATPVGVTQTVTLSDGTRVVLGAASQLVTRFTDGERTAELVTGAAFIAVTPDANRPFSVAAGLLTATVLGTAFDVRKAGDVVRVGVAEGKVIVSHPHVLVGVATGGQRTHTLTAGMHVAAHAYDGLEDVTASSADAIGQWREGRLVFYNASLAEFVADANRYSKLSVRLADGLALSTRCRISGAFDANDIIGMLSTLETIHPLKLDQTSADTLTVRSAPRRGMDPCF
ncbi:MAG: FecR domain-containing protein [Sphingomonadales bacterium]